MGQNSSEFNHPTRVTSFPKASMATRAKLQQWLSNALSKLTLCFSTITKTSTGAVTSNAVSEKHPEQGVGLQQEMVKQQC